MYSLFTLCLQKQNSKKKENCWINQQFFLKLRHIPTPFFYHEQHIVTVFIFRKIFIFRGIADQTQYLFPPFYQIHVFIIRFYFPIFYFFYNAVKILVSYIKLYFLIVIDQILFTKVFICLCIFYNFRIIPIKATPKVYMNIIISPP